MRRLWSLLVAASLLLIGLRMEADPLDSWTWRGPRPPSGNLYGLTFGQGLFVAVGTADWPSSIITSPNGNSWTGQKAPAQETLYGVTWGGGLFVAVGANGSLFTSDDAVDWVSRSTGVTNRLTSVGYGAGTFVVAGEQGIILTSGDGVQWQARDSKMVQNLSAVAFGNGQFVCAGMFNTVVTSPDAITWSPHTLEHPNPYFNFQDLIFGGGHFVGVADELTFGESVVTSEDGVSWNAIRPNNGCFMLHGACFGNNLFIAVPDYGTSVAVSADAATWNCTGSLPISQPLYRVAFGNGRFVAVGELGTIVTSTDGLNWNNEQEGEPAQTLYDVSWGNGIFVAGGASSIYEYGSTVGRTILNSTSGVTWEKAGPPQSRFGPAIWGSLPVRGTAYGAGRFVAVQLQDGSAGQFSSNGDEWFAAFPSGPAGSGVTFGNGTFVSVGPDYYGFTNPNGGRSAMVAVSIDGVSWTVIAAPSTNYLNGVAFGQDRFVAVGKSGTILVSKNGTEWQQASSGTDVWLNRVAYGNGAYVACGPKGTIVISEDAFNWKTGDSNTHEDLYGIGFGDESFVAVGTSGTILTSTNGLNWAKRESGTRNTLLGVTYGGGSFVVVGAHGTILQSGVKPFTLRFTRFSAHPNDFQATLLGEPGRSFRVQVSSNLVDWAEISVINQPQGSGVVLLDANQTTAGRRFYRAVAP